MTFSTLITCHVRTQEAYDTVAKAINTHQHCTDSQLHVWDHDGFGTKSRNNLLQAHCAAAKATYHYEVDPYHQTAWWNQFVVLADTDYVILSTADVVFHAGWLDEIKAGIKRHPGMLSYHPVSVNPYERGQCYVNDASALRPDEFVITANPLCHVIVHERLSAHMWDEQFPFYEADMDYHLTMERGSRKACVCLGSRVDHGMGSSFVHSGPSMPEDRVQARRRLEAKWGLPRIEY